LLAVETQRRVGLGEMVVRADLDRPVSGIGNRQRDRLAALVDLDLTLRGDNLAGDHGLLLQTTASATPATATSAPALRTMRRPPPLRHRQATPRPMACSSAVASAKPAA